MEASTLLKMTRRYPETEFYVDSAMMDDIEYGLARGAVGVTTNPPLVAAAMRHNAGLWRTRALHARAGQPDAGVEEIAGRLHRQLVAEIAGCLLPVYEGCAGGRQGRVAAQVDPHNAHSAALMVKEAQALAALGPNIQVKLPATAAGIRAIETCTCLGISAIGTVSFTVPQAVAIARAVDRGLEQRRQEGLSTQGMAPMSVVMAGRLDGWLKEATGDKALPMPQAADWAGVAVIKRLHAIFQQRGYHARLLGAAFRQGMHWEQLVGGRLTMTMNRAILELVEDSALPPAGMMGRPVPGAVMEALERDYPDFDLAYREDGMTVDAFETFGAVRRTMAAFLDGAGQIRTMVGEWLE